MNETPYKVGIIAGEQSGQLLASDLITELRSITGRPIKLVGVGGELLESQGLNSLFDPAEIGLIGLSALILNMYSLLRRVRQTAQAIINEKPDCLILVDSPEFSLRVAKRVKKALPNLVTIKYVAPTVWAWRPGRAPKMRLYIDHILSVFPFEPEVMKNLGGPNTHYVGHRLMAETALEDVWRVNSIKERAPNEPLNLLILPGSRSNEIKTLLSDFGKTVDILTKRGNKLKVAIPTLPKFEEQLRQETKDWSVQPTITTGREGQIKAYEKADVALAASGTVTLELALAGIPAISCYRLDFLGRQFQHLVTAWSAALPNIIADKPIIPEYYNELVRPEHLARGIEHLSTPAMRKAMMQGYQTVWDNMRVDSNPSAAAAKIVADILAKK